MLKAMLFQHPTQSIDFEIPDDWIREVGGMKLPREITRHYSFAIADATVVPISRIAAPRRNEGIRWFDKDRSVNILTAIKTQLLLPPIKCYPGKTHELLTVQDGFHRYYLSIAMGLSEIPVILVEFFDFHNPNA